MGICLSKRIAESPKNSGRSSSRTASGGGIQLSQSSSKASTSSYPATPRSECEILQSPNVKSFSFGDLKAATRNFRPETVIGEGGFGSVFKGWLDEYSLAPSKPGSNMVVAVKRLKQDSWQGHSEWLAEINYLGQLQHPNLVKLIGYCFEDDHRLLVYEYMQKGSLENHLFRRGSYFEPLSWSLRMKIALGAARGLAFLHSADAKVIYRDFKTSNILLDSNYHPKLSDFGLARDGPADDKSYVSTRVMGTYGYAAPEYLSTGHLTAKSDVYSFGVVLLEIITGRRAIDKHRPPGEHSLIEWAKPYLSNRRRVLSIVDPRLQGVYPITVVGKTSLLALQCVSSDPRNRPSMDEIVKSLEDLHESKGPSSDRTNQKSQGSQAGNPPNSRPGTTPVASAYPRPSASSLYA